MYWIVDPNVLCVTVIMPKYVSDAEDTFMSRMEGVNCVYQVVYRVPMAVCVLLVTMVMPWLILNVFLVRWVVSEVIH